jgi:AcrR family transcriptional regulator
MNIRQRISAEDMRERILMVAEEHFRRIGYGKTAVADIAGALGMSPANIYRFFSSKSAINDAICGKIMREVSEMAMAIARQPEPASVRFQTLILALHRHNKARLTHEHRLFDMVEAAMEENWPAIETHCDHLIHVMAEIIRAGIASGEFRAVDADQFAETAFEAANKVIHPTMIAHCARCSRTDQEEQALRISGLILAALRP